MNGQDNRKPGPPKRVLIIGGGIAGIAAAHALEAWGASVHLVEKKDRLGGKACEWSCMATEVCQNCGACLGAEWRNRAEGLHRIRVHLETEVDDIRRTGDHFQVLLKGRQNSTLSVDAVLLATGFEPFDPSTQESLHYAAYEKIITTVELNKIIKEEGLTDFFSHQETPRLAFIQCIGSRNREQGRDYCSQVCCKVALRQANKVMNLIPGAQITLFYMDLQIQGKEFRSQFSRIRSRVKLIQGVPAEIQKDYEPDKLTVIQEDEKTGARIAHHFDAVILSVGMVPAVASGKIGQLLGMKSDSWGFYAGEGAMLPDRTYIAGAAKSPTDILNAKEQGLVAAHAIARDLELLPQRMQHSCVAILGNGPQGMMGAVELASKGYQVKYLDTGIRDVATKKGLHYFPSSKLLAVTGSTGEYAITIQSDQNIQTVRADAIVVATEAERAQPPTLGLDFGSHRVLGLDTFEQKPWGASADGPHRIVFLLDTSGPEWKENARRCLLLASRVAENEKDVSILMNNMPVHGHEGQRLYDLARQKGVRFLRIPEGDPPHVSCQQEYVSLVIHEATLGRVPVTLHCDLLVIPESVHPSRESSSLHEILKIELDEEDYLQSANIRHRLMAASRKGLFFLGSCHDETDDGDLHREISTIEAYLDLNSMRSYPSVGPMAQIKEARCARCLTCLRVCPHGAVFLQDAFQPRISSMACFGCGLCVAACPAGAIELDEGFMEPRQALALGRETVVFACERSAALAAKEAQQLRLGPPESVRLTAVPCAGCIPIEIILSPFLGNTERVLILGCHEGNCRSGLGGVIASNQVRRILLDTGISHNQLGYRSIAANEPYKMNRIITNPAHLGKDGRNGKE